MPVGPPHVEHSACPRSWLCHSSLLIWPLASPASIPSTKQPHFFHKFSLDMVSMVFDKN